MLEALDVLRRDARVYRLANPRNELKALSELGLDEAEISEVVALLRRTIGPNSPATCIHACFEIRNINGLPFGPNPSRFSNGHWPVCYTSLEVETAESEVIFHFGKNLFSEKGKPRKVFYHILRAEFSGLSIDLRKMVETWPRLVDPHDYTFCQKLGREAVAAGVDGLLTCSARKKDGVNLPVFSRAALSNEAILEVVAFTSVDSGDGSRIEKLRP